MITNLTGVHLISVSFNLNMHLTDVHLPGVHFTGVHLPGVHLTGVYLTGVHLPGVHLTGVHLTDMHLPSIYLLGVYCQNHPISAMGWLVDGDWPVFSDHVIAKRPPGRFCTGPIFCSRTTTQTVNQSVNPAQSASI